MTGILGKKIGMSRITVDGNFVPVTYIEATPNEIVQVKTPEKDGYSALVLGFDAYARPTKNRKFKHVREVKVEDSSSYKVGDKVTLADLGEFAEGVITGVSKGKGFQGPVRRWNRRVARKSHGTKYIRHGSTMSSAITGRSKPGIKMAGHMGVDTVTLRNRKIVAVNTDKNVYAVKGAVPGAVNGLVVLHSIK